MKVRFCTDLFESSEGMSEDHIETAKESEPKSKKKRLGLSLKKKQKCVENRFQQLSSLDIEKAKAAFVPPNTQWCTDWAIRTFELWRRQRNTRAPSNICPESILDTEDTNLLCHWFCVFCQEGRKEDRE